MSQNCTVKHVLSPLGQRQICLLKEIQFIELFYDKTRTRWPFNTGYCLIEVTALAGVTVSILDGNINLISFTKLLELYTEVCVDHYMCCSGMVLGTWHCSTIFHLYYDHGRQLFLFPLTNNIT